MTTETTCKHQIANELTGDLTDPNHVSRRYFSLWLDGSYNGDESRQGNLQTIADCKTPKQLRSFVVSEFTKFMAADHHCSYGHAQKSIVAALPTATLEQLTADLMQDCVDFHADQAGRAAFVSKIMDLQEAYADAQKTGLTMSETAYRTLPHSSEALRVALAEAEAWVTARMNHIDSLADAEAAA